MMRPSSYNSPWTSGAPPGLQPQQQMFASQPMGAFDVSSGWQPNIMQQQQAPMQAWVPPPVQMQPIQPQVHFAPNPVYQQHHHQQQQQQQQPQQQQPQQHQQQQQMQHHQRQPQQQQQKPMHQRSLSAGRVNNSNYPNKRPNDSNQGSIWGRNSQRYDYHNAQHQQPRNIPNIRRQANYNINSNHNINNNNSSNSYSSKNNHHSATINAGQANKATFNRNQKSNNNNDNNPVGKPYSKTYNNTNTNNNNTNNNNNNNNSSSSNEAGSQAQNQKKVKVTKVKKQLALKAKNEPRAKKQQKQPAVAAESNDPHPSEEGQQKPQSKTAERKQMKLQARKNAEDLTKDKYIVEKSTGATSTTKSDGEETPIDQAQLKCVPAVFGFVCKLCDVFLKDKTLRREHIDSSSHMEKFKVYDEKQKAELAAIEVKKDDVVGKSDAGEPDTVATEPEAAHEATSVADQVVDSNNETNNTAADSTPSDTNKVYSEST